MPQANRPVATDTLDQMVEIGALAGENLRLSAEFAIYRQEWFASPGPTRQRSRGPWRPVKAAEAACETARRGDPEAAGNPLWDHPSHRRQQAMSPRKHSGEQVITTTCASCPTPPWKPPSTVSQAAPPP